MIEQIYVGKTGGRQGQPFIPLPRRGFITIDCLPMLIGKPWDDVALGYVQALRPTHVRVVTDDTIQLDAQTWRVTVYLSGSVITQIEQEVEVGLPDGVKNGASMLAALEFGVNSPQVGWHNLDGMKYYAADGTYNVSPDGVKTPYPELTLLKFGEAEDE